MSQLPATFREFLAAADGLVAQLECVRALLRKAAEGDKETVRWLTRHFRGLEQWLAEIEKALSRGGELSDTKSKPPDGED